MTRIAFFGHDSADAAVRRRVQGFRDDGVDVTGFMMRRRDDVKIDWDNVDLGRTFDGNYGQRIKSIFSGARLAAEARDKLAACDVIYARNLDMLATAFLAKRYARLNTPVVYECLDVHRLLTRNDPIGFVFRRIEGALMARCRKLVVSSQGFLDNYFARRHAGNYDAVVIENRLTTGGILAPRPRGPRPPSEKLRIGWVGNLRCKRSLDLLLDVALRNPGTVEVHLHGQPALTEIPDFDDKVKRLPNLVYHGRYAWPADLASIYAGTDIVWAGDFMEAGFNSEWLLPNRLYEGGYYAVPPLAPANSETGKWVSRHGVGFTINEDLASTLPALIQQLIDAPRLLAEKRDALLLLPDETFVQPYGAHRKIIDDVLGRATQPQQSLAAAQ